MRYPIPDFSGWRRAREHEGTDNMADHKHGEMNIDVQEKTFKGFVKAVTWSSVAILFFLVFIALVNG